MSDEQKTVVLCFPTDRHFVEDELAPSLNSRLFSSGSKDDTSICISSADAATLDTWVRLVETCSKLVVVVSAAGISSVGASTNAHSLLG